MKNRRREIRGDSGGESASGCRAWAACEGFFGRLKNEMYYGRTWRSTNELQNAIHPYIDFYNTTRIKVSLGGYSIQAYRMLNQLESELS